MYESRFTFHFKKIKEANVKSSFKTVFLILALFLLPFAVMANGQEEKGSEPIKLGGVWPLADITGEQGSKSAQLAVDEINAAGGLLGRQVELIVLDSEFKPEKGAAALERLATIENVDVFLGGMASSVHLGQIPTLKKYRKLTVWTGAASSRAEEAVGPDAPWYFHLHPWDYNQGESYVEGWLALSEKYNGLSTQKWFMAYEDGAFGTASYNNWVTLWGDIGIVEGESFISAAAGGGDYSAILEHAKEFDPDVFVWAGYAADALPVMEQSKAIGFTPKTYIGSPPGWPTDFGDSPLSENVMFYGMWTPEMNKVSTVSKHYFDAYVAKYDTAPVTYFAPLGYSAVYIIAEAIKRAGTLETEALIQAMEATAYKSPLGETITFGPSNTIQHQGIRRQKIIQWQDEKQEIIWPFEYQTAEPVYPFPAWSGR